MIYLTIIFFALTAVLGMILLGYVLSGKNTPKAIVFIHGPMALISIILLIFSALMYLNILWLSVVIFVLAAMGGLWLFYRDMTGKPVIKWVALIHGSVALIGFISLLALVISNM